MNQRKLFGIGLVLIMVGLMVGGLPVLVREVEASPGTIYVPDNFTTIQQAVNAASSGDTIIVRDGTYTENVDVNTANLTIKSENGTANCIVNASNPSDDVFQVTANYVNITGFTVENATGTDKAGIYLGSADHCNISSNNATSNDYGICLSFSSNNTLSNNTASNNTWDGIHLDYSSNNTFTNNTASSNSLGIWVHFSSNNTLRDNTAASNDNGIYMSFWSNHNTLTKNTVSNNVHGIWVLNSSSNNNIYNNYFNNTNNVLAGGNNTWNTTKTLGTNIIGGPYLGGNYWSDYNGTDTDGDGFGETAYNIIGDSNKDHLPLVPAAPPPVGGTVYPVNKLAILAPWIALLAAIIAGASVLMLRRRRT